MAKMTMEMSVNGELCEEEAPANITLLDFLRDKLGFSGVKMGCNMGECGACTVLVDGVSVNSCLMLAAEAQGKEVTSIEGLSKGTTLHPLQKAFAEFGGAQCGYCTPGMIVAAKAVLDENPDPSDEEIRFALAGNICRCTGYVKIVEAVQEAAAELRAKGGDHA